jgi:glycosyltransferase involved in cell wall biosynthesis
MKLLIVTGIFPPDIGGPATYVPRIASALAARGHDVTAVTLSDRLDHPDALPFRLVRLPRHLPLAQRQARTVATIARLGCDADAIYVNGLALEAVIANAALGRPLVQKVVGDLAWERATNRGWVCDTFDAFQARRYGPQVELLRSLRGWWTRQADRVIVPSRYLARAVAGWGVRSERVEVILNAVEPVGSVAPADLMLDAPVRAVFVGRLVPWKGMDGVLRALAQVPGLGLAVVGDGAERTGLEALANDLGLGSRVRFFGALPASEARAVMAGCDLFVLNSTYEGLPHVALEAMTLGLPVVATAVGGTPEVVRDGENGRLVPLGDASALARTLAELCDEATRQRYTAGARRTVAALSQDAMIAATERVLMGSAAGAARERVV